MIRYCFVRLHWFSVVFVQLFPNVDENHFVLVLIAWFSSTFSRFLRDTMWPFDCSVEWHSEILDIVQRRLSLANEVSIRTWRILRIFYKEPIVPLRSANEKRLHEENLPSRLTTCCSCLINSVRSLSSAWLCSKLASVRRSSNSFFFNSNSIS